MKKIFYGALLFFGLIFWYGCSSKTPERINNQAIQAEWPSDMPWWKANNLRLIQTNLPAYEAGLNVDSLIADLQYFSANVLLINADVIEKCHNLGIRVIVRFDFSRVHEKFF